MSTPVSPTNHTASPAAIPLGSSAMRTGAASGLSAHGVPGADDLPNRRDQPRCSASRRSRAPVLLLTTPRKMPRRRARASNSLAARQCRQPFEMDSPKVVEIDLARLLPSASPKMQRKALAQAEAHPRPGLLRASSAGLPIAAMQQVERLVDRRPSCRPACCPSRTRIARGRTKPGSSRSRVTWPRRARGRPRRRRPAERTRACRRRPSWPSMRHDRETHAGCVLRAGSLARDLASATVNGRSTEAMPCGVMMSSSAIRVTPLRMRDSYGPHGS